MISNRRKQQTGGTIVEFPTRDLRRRRGSVLVEATFVSAILFGLIWLAWDLCWVLFAASRMQMAVNLAARAAETGQLQLGGTTLKGTIALVAENAAPEFLSATLACQSLKINFYDQSGNAVSAPVNLGVVTVSVQNYPSHLIAPIFAIGKGTQNSQVSAVGSAGAAISVSASRVSQACDPLNCPAVGTWPPSTCP
jgi:Flp pilus assembly protein TadG